MASATQPEFCWSAGDLLSRLPLEKGGWSRIALSGLSLDSRSMKPGYLFVALNGTRGHGLAYLSEAVEQGRIRPGDLVALAAFGAGLTWAAGLVRW